MTATFDINGNYHRAIRAALNGDPSALASAIRGGVPMTPADRSMLADFVAGSLQMARPRRGRGRPRTRTLAAMLRSTNWQDRATLEYFIRSERAKAEGRHRAPAAAIHRDLAREHGVPLDRLVDTIKRRLPAVKRGVAERAEAETLMAEVRAIRAKNQALTA